MNGLKNHKGRTLPVLLFSVLMLVFLTSCIGSQKEEAPAIDSRLAESFSKPKQAALENLELAKDGLEERPDGKGYQARFLWCGKPMDTELYFLGETPTLFESKEEYPVTDDTKQLALEAIRSFQKQFPEFRDNFLHTAEGQQGGDEQELNEALLDRFWEAEPPKTEGEEAVSLTYRFSFPGGEVEQELLPEGATQNMVCAECIFEKRAKAPEKVRFHFRLYRYMKLQGQ